MDAGTKMMDDLTKERNAMERIWASRTKTIEKLTKNAAALPPIQIAKEIE